MNSKDRDYLEIRNKIKYAIFIIVYFLIYPFAKLLYGSKRNWLICERGFDAQDNGFYFFKYIREVHPDINVVYLIKKNSNDYAKANKYGRTVEYGSFKHFIMVIGCPVKISSHLYGYAPWVQMATFFRRRKTRDVHVFLQHGITKNFQKGFLSKNCNSLGLFICGAKPEFEYILNEFGYNNNAPQYTGFPRYDSLLDSSNDKKQILVFPTWRRYLSGMNIKDFPKSLFYQSWNELLANKCLLKKCKNECIKIILCLHPSLRNYQDCFVANDVVSVVSVDNCDVQTLIRESKMLVTDFSSIFYDFAFLKKPVIYFQFDEDNYYSSHYDKGYFDYRKDGFGPVCLDTEDVVKNICNYIDNNYSLDDIIIKRRDSHFSYNDRNNSKRVYNCIVNLLNN